MKKFMLCAVAAILIFGFEVNGMDHPEVIADSSTVSRRTIGQLSFNGGVIVDYSEGKLLMQQDWNDLPNLSEERCLADTLIREKNGTRFDVEDFVSGTSPYLDSLRCEFAEIRASSAISISKQDVSLYSALLCSPKITIDTTSLRDSIICIDGNSTDITIRFQNNLALQIYALGILFLKTPKLAVSDGHIQGEIQLIGKGAIAIHDYNLYFKAHQ